MTAFYNENDPKAAAWLRELIKQGHIAPGVVDERSIADIDPAELAGYVQCHFFAGIGVWSYALRRAGWPDDRPVWTGSCPCQPFSAAGQRKGNSDHRHLWPEFFRLIAERRPGVIFGEQVASKDALSWLDHVSTDLEGEGYAVGAVDTCAAGFGAPHIRQRLYFVAQSKLGIGGYCGSAGEQGRIAVVGRSASLRQDNGEAVRSGNLTAGDAVGLEHTHGIGKERPGAEEQIADAGREVGGLDDAPTAGLQGLSGGGSDSSGGLRRKSAEGCGRTGSVDNPTDARRQGEGQHDGGSPLLAARPVESSPVGGFWSNAHWIPCRGGKWRPIEPGTFPLAHGSAARMGRLRGYGNAIVAPVAEEFIRAYLGLVR